MSEIDDVEDDFDEPDALCTDCGEDVFAEDRHFVEGFERFGAILCSACFDERCEADDDGQPDEAQEWADYDPDC